MVDEETKELIKQAVDIEMLLVSLGFKVYKSTQNEIRAPCAIHGGDNPTAFSIRTDIGRWKCFTRRCEEDESGIPHTDIVSLVQKCLGLSFIDSLQYIADIAGLGISVRDANASGEVSYQKDIHKTNRVAKYLAKSSQRISTVDEATVQSYIQNRTNYFTKQGFSERTIDFFEVGSKIDRYGIERATIPIRDHEGYLVSVSARRTDGDAEPRYILDQDFEKDKVLYNLHNVLNTGESTLILVEGFKACWAVYESGFENVAACMGSVLTYGQAMLLSRLPILKVVVLLDGDKAGRDGTTRTVKRLEKFMSNVIPIHLNYGDSPDSDSLSRNDLFDLIALFNY